MSEPLVDIIIPVFNSVKFIDRTINSALSQTYQNIRIILCDDGSTDGTYEYLFDKFKNNERIILLRNQYEKGSSGARLTALKESDAEWVAYLDSDDEWKPEKIAFQLAFCLKNNVDFSYSDYEVYGFKTGIVRSINAIHSSKFFLGNFFGTSTVMHRRKLFREFPTNIKKRTDYLMWLSYSNKNDFVARRVPGLLTRYNKQENSLSTGAFSNLSYHIKVIMITLSSSYAFALMCALTHVTFNVFRKRKLFKFINRINLL